MWDRPLLHEETATGEQPPSRDRRTGSKCLTMSTSRDPAPPARPGRALWALRPHLTKFVSSRTPAASMSSNPWSVPDPAARESVRRCSAHFLLKSLALLLGFETLPCPHRPLARGLCSALQCGGSLRAPRLPVPHDPPAAPCVPKARRTLQLKLALGSGVPARPSSCLLGFCPSMSCGALKLCLGWR